MDLSALSSLRTLSIDEECTDDVYDVISSTVGLTNLNMSWGNGWPEGFFAMPQLSGLVALDVGVLSEMRVDELSALRQLTVLSC